LRFLGCGTSFGVPVIGCACTVCTSADPRNHRTRHSLVVERDDKLLLVDTPPELRQQLLAARIGHVDAVYLTHLHADHIHGIDDLRIFSLRRQAPLRTYVASEYVAELEARFPYIFDPSVRLNPKTSVPRIDLHTFDVGERIDVAGFEMVPLSFPHGHVNAYGFRIGPLGVVVDGKRIPGEAKQVLRGVEVLVINALWWGDPHPTHFNVEEALDAARSVGARRTYLTHLTHRLDYQELAANLPEGFEPAYDGLVVNIE
ncbi:MAG: MBL fold metallo-hydrolase, partial [Gemmatimonadales bacterium]